MFTFKKSHLATLVAAMALGLASSAVLAKGGDSGRGHDHLPLRRTPGPQGHEGVRRPTRRTVRCGESAHGLARKGTSTLGNYRLGLAL